MQERLMLGVMGNNPLRYLNGRRVCIADRLRAYQYKLMHYKGADDSVQQEVPPSGVQMDLRGTDSQELEQYLLDLVLITSVSKHCICSTGGASNGGLHAARDVATSTHSGGARRAAKGEGEGAGEGEGERLCQHGAANFVMALDIVPGLHYDPTCVVELSDTHGFGLTAAPLAKALPLFCNLRRLNLSRNRLATLCGLGLEGMVHLQVLDVSSNAVRDRIRNLGATLDALPRLVALMLRNNPCMRTRAERMRLMQAMTRLGHVSCSLRYIDTAITMAERVQAWAQASSRSPVELEMLKQKALLNLSTPPETPLSSLVELDLSSRSLRALHGELLAPLVRLRRLMLQDNALTSLAAAQLDRLTSLQALDLRRNALTDSDGVLRMAISLSNLQELGVGGNPWRAVSRISLPEPFTGQVLCDGEGGSEGDGGEASARGGGSAARAPDMHRLLLAALSGRYSQDPHYPLRFIDDEQIAIPHIVRACSGGAEAAGSKLAFDLTVARQMQDCVSLGVLAHDARIHELRQLDLSNRELCWVDFSRMPMLTQLLLQHNHLSDEALAAGALLQLTCLQHLDLSFNRIESASLVGDIVAAGHKSRSLSSVTISHNPCFPSTNLYEHRVGFLAATSVVASVGAAGATLSLLNEAEISVEERVDAVERFLRSPEGGQAAGSQPQASAWFPSVLCSNKWSSTQSQQQQSAEAGDEDRVAGAVEGVRLTLLLEQRRYSYSSASVSLAHKRLACLIALRDYAFLSVLDVRGNELRCLNPLGSLPRLRRLDVRDNKVALPAACLALASSSLLLLASLACEHTGVIRIADEGAGVGARWRPLTRGCAPCRDATSCGTPTSRG
jgi:Leucine-rich repeat (LRR) protein